jgi:uncharacterized protein
MTLSITPLYAGLLAILYIVLGSLVVSHRRRARIGLGIGGDTALERAVRVHGNFGEYTPLFLVLLLAAELGGAAPWLLHPIGAAYFLARIFHAFGLSQSSGTSVGRFVGTLLTWTGMLVLALANIWLALG